MDDLKNLRGEIDKADDRILQALAARRKLTDRVLRAKSKKTSLRDVRREERILNRLTREGRRHGLDAHLVTRVYQEIIDDSLRTQRLQLMARAHPGRRDTIRVTFQGIEGAYSQLAAYKFFAKEIERSFFAGCESFDDTVRAVERDAADYAVLPIENTTAGSINQVYDLLAGTSLTIVGEVVLRIDHCLLALADVSVFKIRRVLSHPQALAQCGKFLGKLHNCQTEFFADTAMAVRKVREDRDPLQAAIASEDAGRRYGLKVLRRNLADRRENFTRFLVAAKTPVQVERRVPCKTSLIMATPHAEGALLKALDVFHRHKLNMTKLESRPRSGTRFQYLFYVDLEGNLADPNIMAAFTELRKMTTYLKILGSYPAQEGAKTPRARSKK
ncbi:MAG: prephenate dehydratase [Elusimicrobiota bacterium]